MKLVNKFGKMQTYLDQMDMDDGSTMKFLVILYGSDEIQFKKNKDGKPRAGPDYKYLHVNVEDVGDLKKCLNVVDKP